MMTTRSTVNSKRDLHIGGTGAGAPAALATMGPRWAEHPTPLDVLRGAQRSGRQLLRRNPGAAIGLAAVIGVMAGYFLTRRL